MQPYIDMGFSEEMASRAVQYYPEDVEGATNYLLCSQNFGKLPTRFTNTPQRFLGSFVIYDGVGCYVRVYEPDTKIVCLEFQTSLLRVWVHISDPMIRWINTRHRRPLTPWKPEWKKRLIRISLPIDNFTDTTRHILKDSQSDYSSRLKAVTATAMSWSPAVHYWRMIRRFQTIYRKEPRTPLPYKMNNSLVKKLIRTRISCYADIANLNRCDILERMAHRHHEIYDMFAGTEIERKHIEECLQQYSSPDRYRKQVRNQWFLACIPTFLLRVHTAVRNHVKISFYVHSDTWKAMHGLSLRQHAQMYLHDFRLLQEYSQALTGSVGRTPPSFAQIIREEKPEYVYMDQVGLGEYDHLYDHQRKCLQWLIHRERSRPTSAWGWALRWTYHNVTCWTSRFGIFSQRSPSMCTHGGILCQNVGAGKTVEMLALMKFHKLPQKTLVVCPTSMLGVWESEAKKFVPNLSVSVKEVATAADIVITTYRAVVSDNQRQWPRYRDVTWGRIILDEAHAIGFDSSATAQSLFKLKANYRWCVTATPEAKPHILYSMYRFLKISPFHGNHIPTEAFPLRPSTRGFDNRRVTPTSIVREMYSTTNSNTRGNIYQVMADLAQEVCYADDFCTEKTVEYEVVSVTPKDNTLYETLLGKFKQEYSTRVVKNARFIHFLKWLTQAAHNPSLLPLIRYGTLITAAASQLNLERFTQKLGDNGFDDSVKTVLASIQKGEELCSVCMDVIDRPTITPCKHVFCHECIHRWITKKRFCCLCRQAVQPRQLRELVDKPLEEEMDDDTINISTLSGDCYAVPKTLRDLYHTHQNEPSPKIAHLAHSIQQSDHKWVVFSSCSDNVRAIQEHFNDVGVKHCSINGSMSPARRQKSLDAFKKDAQVFVMTLRAANCGITLVEAAHIVFMEPCFNAAIKKQAIGRINRIGQTKDSIKVITYIMKGTIDEHTIDCTDPPSASWIKDKIIG